MIRTRTSRHVVYVCAVFLCVSQAVIGLSEAVDLEAVVQQLTSCDEESTAISNDLGVTHMMSVPGVHNNL